MTVRQLREKKAWSQEDFAVSSDLHRTFVGNIERGLKNTTILTLVMISQALGNQRGGVVAGVGKEG